MIGQDKLKTNFINLFNNGTLTRTNILIAPEGYGKKEFIKWFSNYTNIPYKLFNNSINDIREAIELSHNEFTSQIYVFENIDKNKATQNAALKLFEEPSNNIYIFVLCEDKNLLLPTILNRGNIYYFEKYNLEELKKFNNNELALKIFNNPKDLLNINNLDINNLLNTTTKIIEKLDLANISNALKLNNYIKSKDNEEGYDLNIFIKALKYSFVQLYNTTRDDNILRKFTLLQTSLNHIKSNNKYFMDNFILSNYIEVKNGHKRV